MLLKSLLLPQRGDRVEIDYQIWLKQTEDNDRLEVEQSKDFNRPFVFQLGNETRVITFFTEHMLNMTLNESKTVETLCEKIYGNYGHPLKGISADQVLVVQFKFCKILRDPSTESPLSLSVSQLQVSKNGNRSEEKSREWSVCDSEVAMKLKEEGNKLVSAKNYTEATQCYLQGIQLFQTVNIDDLPQPSQTLLIQFYTNLALCEINLKNFNSAMNLCRSVLGLSFADAQAKSKAHYRMGQALEAQRTEYIKSIQKGQVVDKEWCVKEAQHHYRQSIVLEGKENPDTTKKIQNLEKSMVSSSGLKFDGMFARELDRTEGLAGYYF
jgi:tetratricopeptide (TPR) repeat protein